MEIKLCMDVQDFLYLIKFVFLSIQCSVNADGTLNNNDLANIPKTLEFLVT